MVRKNKKDTIKGTYNSVKLYDPRCEGIQTHIAYIFYSLD